MYVKEAGLCSERELHAALQSSPVIFFFSSSTSLQQQETQALGWVLAWLLQNATALTARGRMELAHWIGPQLCMPCLRACATTPALRACGGMRGARLSKGLPERERQTRLLVRLKHCCMGMQGLQAPHPTKQHQAALKRTVQYVL